MRNKPVLFSILILSYLLCLTPASLFPQKNASYFKSPTGVQYGYSLKIQADYSKVEKLTFKIGIAGGIGAFWGKDWLYPTLNGELIFFHGGIGSNWPGNRKHFFDAEALLSYMITGGFDNRMVEASKARPGMRNYPLYYFNNWSLPPLQNPFRWSASVGGNLIYFPTRAHDRVQLVGVLNTHFDRVQLTYINDGPPFYPPLGDRGDRLHTGGGFISFHGNDNWAVNLVEVGYNKFTGFFPSAYELSNKLGNSYVFYKDAGENFYNKGNLYLTVGNTSKQWGMMFNLSNYPKADMQHRIHFKTYNPLHLVPYEGYWSITPVFYFQQSKIGLQ